VTWVGDGNNMCHSYMHAAKLLEFKLNIACPEGFEPQQEFIDETRTSSKLHRTLRPPAPVAT